MTLKSIYQFLKAYFNYSASGNRIYARAISEAMAVLKAALIKKSLSPIQKYLHKLFALSLTKDMLLRFVSLALLSYEEPLEEIEYLKITATIDKSLITTKHRGINIPIEGAYDDKSNKLIIFTFSKPTNMREEVRVIKALLKEFVKDGTSIPSIKTVAYWDLSKGKTTELDYEALSPVDKKSLIEAANRIK